MISPNPEMMDFLRHGSMFCIDRSSSLYELATLHISPWIPVCLAVLLCFYAVFLTGPRK